MAQEAQEEETTIIMAFITASELKKYPLPVTDAQWTKIDNASPYQIDLILDYATQHIKDYLERDIEETSYVERIPGNNRPKLMLNNYPVISIEDIYGTDVYQNVRSQDPADFIIDAKAGLIEWVDKYRNLWFRDYIWTVEYTAGFAEIPGPIKHATALVAVQMLQPIFRGGTNFQQISLMDDANEDIVDMLFAYKRNRIG